ncbi:carboxylesterase family protein [Phlyctema vagabunda]|uniref:Carboxylic ester hydrolase n=1 Tax=Phlyctema vagabunda TaxID=108571 RepID=A0ABR4PRS5_9HELO
MKSLVSLAVLALSYAVDAAPTSSAASALPTIDLGYAVHRATVNSTGQYYNFSNIAFAEPPLGALRFTAPVPPKGRNRTVNDGQQTRICPQANPAWELVAAQYLTGVNVSTLAAQQSNSTLSLSSIPKPGPTENEDCLLLDVLVPEPIFNSKKKRTGSSKGAPVLVWIYGGGYTGGSKGGSGNPAGLIAASQVDKSEGVVFVAMNYRVGMFGWLSGPTFQANGTANVGLYDQRLALEWVQKNIHLFGGDPNRVTVIGESAGGGSIMHHITAYGGLKGKAPFQQAIPQSPAFQNMPSANQQELVFNKVLTYASFLTNRTIATLPQLRALPTSVLQTVNAIAVGLSSYGTFTFGPAVDGKYVPALPGQLLLHGQFDSSVKLMVGHNSNEGLFFTSPFITDNTTFSAFTSSQLPGASSTVLSYITNTLYPAVFDGTYGYRTQMQRANLIVAESSFTCTTRYLATAFRNQTYSYFFTVPPGLHGQDIPYTFYNGAAAINATVARTLQGYITSFAQTGDPNFAGAPSFPRYGANATTLDIDLSSSGTLVRDSVANDRCTWWQKGLYN